MGVAEDFGKGLLGVVGQGISSGGKFVAEKTKYVVKDVPIMNEKSAKIISTYKTQYDSSIGALSYIKMRAESICKELSSKQMYLRDVQLQRLSELYKYSQKLDESNTALSTITSQETVYNHIDNNNAPKIKGNESILAQSALTGVATAGTAFGLVATLGTASTGTAIASLSGAASINATLAALGGGSIATGGAGMLGGIAVLGGFLVVPAMLVGVYKWSSNAEKKYAEALKYKENVEKSVIQTTEILNNLNKACVLLQKDIFITESLSNLTNELSNVLECNLVLNNDYDDIRELCVGIHTIAQDLLSLSLLDQKVQKINPYLEKNLDDILKKVQNLQRLFGYYLISQNRPPVIEVVEVPAKIECLYNAEIAKRFRKALQEAKKSIYIVSPWIADWIFDKNNVRDLIKAAIERKVHVHIVYGINGGKNSNKDKNNIETENNARALNNEFKSTRYFHIKKSNTHTKGVVIDDKYIIAGSYNFLSFKGDYSYRNTRSEMALYTETNHVIKEFKNTYFKYDSYC